MIDYRDVLFGGKVVRSLNVNQTDGTFVTTEPLENGGQIVIYPQSPNNPLYEIVTYQDFGPYGTISFPLDARFDDIRRRMWIADAGNETLIKVNIDNFSLENFITDVVIPHAVIPEVNLGGVFVKAFTDIDTGVVNYYSANATLVDSFSFPCALGHATTDIELTQAYVDSLPLTSTMAYDHVRWRIWWTSAAYIYMADIRNGQVVQHNLAPSYTDTNGLGIEFETGNAYVAAQNDSGDWRYLQIFRDNNDVIGEAYLPSEA